ncbi:MAG: segregation/condensation protein A [Treponema porcinum]|uniref:segregation and condensation protein A n=1 Tax=Treponema porcinum TaxID=261392 RepID=UPI002353BE70|nr:segregation/condensation protein A [Treponema porcinum]MCI6179726.1 segregation/condensation protein A [Treponema porcinum]MCI6482652.1 segregation/condensation protein A [Treponema porcinum]MCI6722177.1 segregation/condensation protein A [Treponema porcinum]MCI6815299.1 segregation/condensation protein A [Treponema porcinum]MCI6984281.1 segregation/condensation protein A [Treponema porcinum]
MDAKAVETLTVESESAESAKRRFAAGEFEGPLDLLWFLIHKSEINIYDIPIAQITEQYLEYLDYAVQTDLGDLSEFYKWAAMLLNMKSKMLLPVEITYDDEEVEDPRQELVDKLIEYQKFKKLSELMEEKEESAEWSFERSKIQRVLPFDERESDWEQIDTWDLLQQMQKLFKSMVSQYSNEKILNMYEEISVNEKITLMNELFEKKNECMFTDLITREGNEMDIVCAFMAILEAVKFKMITIFQNKLFGDIKICKRLDSGESLQPLEITIDKAAPVSEENK